MGDSLVKVFYFLQIFFTRKIHLNSMNKVIWRAVQKQSKSKGKNISSYMFSNSFKNVQIQIVVENEDCGVMK